MLQTSWQSFVARLSALRHGSKAKHRRSSSRQVSRTESLEQRLVLSSFSVINTNDSGAGSFRQAILDANANAGADTIAFAIPGSGLHTIQPLTGLPTISGTVVIDGYTQPGSSANTLTVGDNAVLTIELDGSLASLATTGLTITAGNSTISGLVINRFKNTAIRITGAAATNTVVVGNFIGTDVTGTVSLSNANSGVFITSGANHNTIGGTSAADRNVISGNTGSGIEINGTNNVVLGNYIGTDATGSASLGNSLKGDAIFITAANNTIGGTTVGAGNVLSGNTGSGIRINSTTATGNVIQGNFIGTDATGTADLGNAGYGLRSIAPNTLIGGTTPETRNVISGNGVAGILLDGAFASGNVVEGNYIGTDVTGSVDLGNATDGIRVTSGASNNTIGGTVLGAGNVVSGNENYGVVVAGSTSSGNRIAGNLIGTDATGTAALGNTINGVVIDSAPNTTIGGTTPEERNIISANLGGKAGLVINGSASATNTVVSGNYIGTDITGTRDLGNVDGGILVAGGSNSIIGGTTAGAGNVVSGNDSYGIRIQYGVTGTSVLGNFVGTDFTGSAALGNSGAGIDIELEANGNTIGGTSAAARNIISGNGTAGILISGVNVTNNVVVGNFIGTDVTGTVGLGNADGGIVIGSGANDNTIGGTSAAERNIISGNSNEGIEIRGSDNLVTGNYIGTDVTGLVDLGNTTNGVLVTLNASNNTIGGTAAGAANLISGNNAAGVAIKGSTTVGNVVRGNSIFANSGLGIDLDATGITPNDLGDGDTGSNLKQNFPGIASAQTGATTTVSGTLNSTANTSFTLDFYASTVADPSGHGEGERYLGSATVLTDGSGNASFMVTLAAATTATEAISVTATSPTGNTSEFGGHLPTAVAGGPYAVIQGGSVPLNGSLSSDPDASNTLTYQWDLDGDNIFGETGAAATRGNETGATPTFSAAGLLGFSIVNVTLRVTDTSGLRDEDTASITINTPNPTIQQVVNSGPANEGSSVTVTVTAAAGGSLNYEFDFDNDLVYEVGPQASPIASHTYTDNGTYRVNVRVTNSGGGVATSSTDVVVNNLPPTATDNAYVTNQGFAVSGNVISDAVADSDPAGANDPLTVTSFTQPANGSATVAADGSFTYIPATTFSGTDSFSYSISDGDGGTATAYVTITVAAPAAGSITTVIDTCEGGTALLINGTSAGDHIVVEPGTTPGTLRIHINGTITTVAIPSGRIIVLGDAGDDNIQIAGSISNTVWAYGDAGHDRIFGGGGASLLFGGEGNDQLTGGSGRDILIGGQGADKLVGNSNDDVLIAGYTTKDNRASADVDEFWCHVMEEWNSTNSFSDRLANLRGASTQSANAHNGTSYLLPVVIDDTSSDEIDMLQGSSGNDWFIYRAGEDKVVGQIEAVN